MKGTHMASSPEFLEYVLDLLRAVPNVTTGTMMGEYLLYSGGQLFGGVYDDRFLVKETPASCAAFPTTTLPYDGARPMRVVDVEDPGIVAQVVQEMLPELPKPRTRRR